MGPAPPFFRDSLLQALFYFKRRFARCQLEAVRYAEDVRIDGNSRCIEENAHEDVCCLAAYAGELD